MAWTSFIKIKVVRFRAIGDVTTTTVEMTLPKGSVVGAPDSGVYSDGVLTVVGSYYIKVKRRGPADVDPGGEMQVKFWIEPPEKQDQPTYLLQGIAFSNRDLTVPPGKKDNRLGQVDFPTIEIRTEDIPGGPTGVRVFTVTNHRAAQGKVSYDYLFLIQETEHGRIGIIDPEWENEP